MIFISRVNSSSSSGLMEDKPAWRAIGRISATFNSLSGRLRNCSSLTSISADLLNFSSHASRMMSVCTRRRMDSAPRRWDSRSECSTDVVPTSNGRPLV